MSFLAFDTNIAIYIVNNHPQFADRAIKVVERAEIRGCSLSVILITEFLSFSGRDDSVRAKLDEFLQSFRNTSFVGCSEQIAHSAARILGRYKNLRIADAIHLATAEETGAKEFWTNDQRLVKVQLQGTKIKLLSEIA